MPEGTPDFANAVVRLETTQSGPELLSFLNSLEVFFGRPANHEKNVSRVLDLDLIAIVLDNGIPPLFVLEDLVNEWIASEA